MKLECEKRHRKSKGGEKPRQIEKGVPYGRTLGHHPTKASNQHGRKVSSKTHFTSLHATRGYRTKNLATL